MRNIKIFGLCLFAVGALSACGNVTQGRNQFGNYSVVQDGASVQGSTVGSGQCNYSANITSADSFEISVSNRYVGCKGTTGSVKLYSEDNASKTVCVFPVLYANGHSSVFISNPYADVSARYLTQCQNTDSSGTNFSFGSLSFNAVYVVNQDNVSAFSTCLASASLTACTADYGVQYSFGTL